MKDDSLDGTQDQGQGRREGEEARRWCGDELTRRRGRWSGRNIDRDLNDQRLGDFTSLGAEVARAFETTTRSGQA